MPQRSIQGSAELARKIKNRRNTFGLTIEEAATRAGVGIKTWCRYEAGDSIRRDKCKGVCRALNWKWLPDDIEIAAPLAPDRQYADLEAWSSYLAEQYGFFAAMAFAVGSDMLLDYLEQDLSDLASLPAGTHIGQLNTSFLRNELPRQFLMRYDYEFLYQMRCSLLCLRRNAADGANMAAHSVMEELIIYLCTQEAKAYVELNGNAICRAEAESLDALEAWAFDLFDDCDILTWLYTDGHCVGEDNVYHFLHWNERHFNVND